MFPWRRFEILNDSKKYWAPLTSIKVIPRQAEVAQGVPGRLRPRIFLTFRHYKGGRSSAKRTSRLYPRRNPWYSLSEAKSTSGHRVLSGGTTEKIVSDTTGNRFRDRSTSSRAPITSIDLKICLLILDFRLTPWFEYCIFSFGYFPGVNL